ncbi:MAG: hypothetical protein KBB37_04705 [Bacteroidia bacterium]|nr:hypothetical protein [Bacteroidia bacterium]MBP7260567.1 hypothetical protein [Bacteroidia bacterium]MBP9180839.1 hypothetical protein [Bacteroidia bacterium]
MKLLFVNLLFILLTVLTASAQQNKKGQAAQPKPGGDPTFEIKDGDTINFTDANGIRQGWWRQYWPDGDLKYECMFVNGQKDGLELKYYDNQDCIELSVNYNMGVLDGPTTSYYKTCKVNCEETYYNGIKHGSERCYHEKGWLMSEGYFEEGKLKGAFSHFDETGKVKFESSEKDFTVNLDKFLSGEYKLKDSTIFNVLKRNDNWADMLVIVDMTGSMFPYMGQLVIWFKLNFDLGRVKYFCFFNDGDAKTDAEKKVGQIGGIHMYEAKDFKLLKKSMEETMKLGAGGDAPENNVEALIRSTTYFKNYKQVVMIADNSSRVKDLKYVSRVKKPVKIILCGVGDEGINPDYLKIAKVTKGSIHTINSDIKNLAQLQEGQKITIEGFTYQLINGNFELVDDGGRTKRRR